MNVQFSHPKVWPTRQLMHQYRSEAQPLGRRDVTSSCNAPGQKQLPQHDRAFGPIPGLNATRGDYSGTCTFGSCASHADIEASEGDSPGLAGSLGLRAIVGSRPPGM